MTENEERGPEKSKSEEVLDYLKQKKSGHRIVDVEEEQVQVIIFQLMGELFGIYSSDAKEVLEVEKITPVPGCPEFIAGIVNVRGDVESVIDLNRFFQLPSEAETSKTKVVIAQNREICSGIRVASIEDVLEIPKSSVRQPLNTLGENIRPYVLGETLYLGKNVTMLDMGRIFEKIMAE